MAGKHGRFESGKYSYLFEITIIGKNDLDRWVCLNPIGSDGNNFTKGAIIRRMMVPDNFMVIREESEEIIAIKIDKYSEELKSIID